MQVTTTVLGELLGRFLEAKFFDVDVSWCWVQVGCVGQCVASGPSDVQVGRGWHTYALHSLWMAAALYTSSRYVWALFCPRDYGSPRGVLWEYCERPPYKAVTLDWGVLLSTFSEFA